MGTAARGPRWTGVRGSRGRGARSGGVMLCGVLLVRCADVVRCSNGSFLESLDMRTRER
mgnify:CR=1 FL=1